MRTDRIKIGPSLRMPRRFLRGGYGRLALTILALALGVALVCAIDLANRAVAGAFGEIVDRMAGRAALQITAGEGGQFDESIAPEIASVPGVELAVPTVAATAFTTDGSGDLLAVHGVDVTNDAAVRIYESRDEPKLAIEDPLVFLSQPSSIALTREFAARKGLTLDSTVDLVTPTGRRPFVVRALLEPHGIAKVYGGNLVVMDLQAAEAFFAEPGMINRVDVVARRDGDLERIGAEIATRLPAGLRIETPAQRKADLHRVIGALQTMLSALGMVGLVAAFLISFSRIATMFDARSWQIGMMRTAGIPARVVWWELLKESLIIGAIGVALGIPLGIGLGRLILPVIGTTTSLATKQIVPDAEFRVRAASVVLAAALGMLAALLAASLPAWRASRASPVSILRSQGVELEPPTEHGRWIVLSALAAAIALSVLLQSLTRVAAFGLAATGLIAAATALSARPLLVLATGPVMRGLARLAGPSGRFATTILAADRRRSALNVAMLGVGLGSVFWLWMLAQSFQRTVLTTMPTVLRSDLAISSVHMSAGYVESPIDDTLLAELAKVPGVSAVVGERAFDWQHGGGPIAINAFDGPYFTDPARNQWHLVGASLPGAFESVARGDGVLVSTNFALHLNASVGDRISLATPSGPISVAIVGVVGDFLSSRGTIEMSRDLYRKHWHDSKIVWALAWVAPGVQVQAVRAEIARRLGSEHDLKVLARSDLLQQFEADVDRAFRPIHVVAAMVLLVVLLGMADTLTANVADRTGQLGALRAIGVDGGAVRRIVLLEGAVLGALGLALGLVAGSAMGTLWVTTTCPYLLGWMLDMHVPMLQIFALAGLTLIVSAGSAWLPARRAARLNPAAALRCE